MSILTKIADLELTDKVVLLREDYNVPLTKGRITDESRIQASLATIKQLLNAGAKIIIVSHLGRPVAGQYDAALSLSPVAESLSHQLGFTVPLVQNWLTNIDFGPHRVMLAENVRFEKGEIDNHDDLARQLAGLCQVYINDAFATAHRMQASTYGIVKYASTSAAGPLLINELKSLNIALRSPAKPIIAIVGGAKVTDKLSLLKSLIQKVDYLIVGGGIANTFLSAADYPIGQSLHDNTLVAVAKEIFAQAKDSRCEILLPTDVVCSQGFDANHTATIKPINEVLKTDLIMDFGPHTMQQIGTIITQANTIIWNGPIGVFEFAAYSTGTRNLAQQIASSRAYSVAGGGDTIAAINQFGVHANISYISTGGGAFLQLVEGKKLPAIQILEEASRAWIAMEKSREL